MHTAAPNLKKPATNQRTRIRWVDIAKGMCIGLIVLFHVSLPPHESAVLDSIQAPLSAARVPLFFFCAGLFSHRVIYNDAQWIWRKRVWPWLYPLALWTVIFLTGLHGENLLATVVGIIYPNSFLWFLQGLIVYNVLTWLCRRLPLQAVGVLSIGAVLLLPLIIDDEYIVRVITWWPVFLAGIALHPYLMGKRPYRLSRAHAGGLLLAVVGCYLIGDQICGAMGALIRAPLGVSVAIVIALAIDRWLDKLGQILATAGRHTLPVYLCHLPVDIILEYRIVPALGLTSWAQQSAEIFSLIAAAICIACAVGLELLTRIRGFRWLVYAPQFKA